RPCLIATLSLLVGISWGTEASRADSQPAPSDAEALALCSEFAKADLPSPVSTFWQTFMKELGIITAPAPFSHPAEPIAVSVPEGLRVRSPGGGLGVNAIFSIAPPPSDAAWYKQESVRARRKQLSKEIKSLRKQLRR